jgi:collagenase-like PrtC family protease
MRLSLATNFDDTLLERLRGSPVVEVFGKLPTDSLGGGRATYMLRPLRKARLAEHVRQAHVNGIQFNYLLNTACSGNLESTRRGQRQIARLLDWLEEVGVDSVTVALPFLLRLIKRRYPHLKVKVGVFAGVDELSKAKAWEDLGADAITLDSHAVNRDCRLLEAIRQSIVCDLQLLVNVNCLASCPFARAHMVALSHASQSASSRFMIDYCLLLCGRFKASEKVNYIRSNWIRPEDLHVYESMGYDLFKIAERDAPTSTLLRRVRAYSERRYEGNLLDLVQSFGYPDPLPDRYRGNWRWALRYFLHPWSASLFRLPALLRLARAEGMLSPLDGRVPIYIENRKLDGFLERVIRSGCRGKDCGSCRYCHEIAEEAVEVDSGFQKERLELYQQLLENFDSGRLWSWW